MDTCERRSCFFKSLMPIYTWLEFQWVTHTCTHARAHTDYCMSCRVRQNDTSKSKPKNTIYKKQLSDDTHSLSEFRGIFLGMVRRPSPWQSTVVPLQVHRAGQAPALPMSKAESITSHIQRGCRASLPRNAPKRFPLPGMFTSTEACSFTKSCDTLQVSLQEWYYLLWIWIEDWTFFSFFFFNRIFLASTANPFS